MKKTIYVFSLLVSNYFLSQNNFTLITPKPSDSKANKVVFSNTNTGFIINGKRELLYTTDQGVNWTVKETLNFLPRDIKFRNNVGFIVGDNTILRSDDYGMTWNKVNVFGSLLNSINFINDDVVYISGQTQILKSSDKGLSFPVDTTMYSMSAMITVFTDANSAHVATYDGRIRKTVDGGNTWVTTVSDSSSSNNFYSLVFPSQNVGYANKGFGDMLKTIDGGLTWTTLNYNVYNKETYGMQFFDENNGYTVGKDGAVYKTANGGASWQWISPNSIYSSDNEYNLNGLYFFDSQKAICVGNNGRIIKTVNGGTNWTNYSPTYDIINELHFVNPTHAYFKTNMEEFFKTSDAGNSWQKVQYPPHESYSNGFRFVNENTGYSIGANQGQVYKTVNGGMSWTQSTVIQYEPLYSVSFLSENVGFVSGGYDTPNKGIYKTVDGANSWQKISDQRFSSLKFFNNNVGYGVLTSSYGKLYKTVDGGITWNICFNGGSSNIYYDLLNENQIFLKGDNGDFFKSSDGGATWAQSQAPFYSFDKIKFADQNVGYIADQERVYRTIDGGTTWTLILNNNYDFDIKTLEIGGDYLYLSGNGGRVYKYSLAFLSASEAPVNHDMAKVYPNPATNDVNVSAKKKITEIRLIDISGKVMKTVKNASQINISEYHSGMYFLEIMYGDQTKQVTKIIKK
ncbi:Por secretion system C-terminal sorting domain-containing protein [Chryseobacterium oleae]|uniref:Por secretion system C-terminal sorting domain-containing protein n=1 Tax=Chryseobacterium oleae TaxID=491207 RepID=A0A1I4VFG0_CHROL|nr:YCF48-related protein [Chryseobacterium oleae]SFM99860.1 Por secretion system C-terminal sorting domain-containing protein [Chryseobacterium oleae]